MKDLLDDKTDEELLSTLIREVAKASSELATASSDITKAQNRIRFSIVLINRLLERKDLQ
jgi:hypothetical protein